MASSRNLSLLSETKSMMGSRSGIGLMRSMLSILLGRVNKIMRVCRRSIGMGRIIGIVQLLETYMFYLLYILNNVMYSNI